MDSVSIWSMTCEIPPRESLKENCQADVLVIGAGLAGILIADELQKRGKQVVIAEATRIAAGVSKNTTAKITSQHDLCYDRLLSKFGEDLAAQYARANEEAIKRYADIIEKERIACDFVRKDAFVYALTDTEQIENEVKAAQKLGIAADLVYKVPLPLPIAAAVRFPNQAQFHPLKFIKAIADKLTIYEQTMVESVDGNVAQCAHGPKITAAHIVVATHFPFINVPGYYFLRLFQDRSYVLALAHAADVGGMYVDADDNGYSFRNEGDLLIFGGLSHRSGKHPAGGCYEKLRQAAKEFYPQSREVAHWSAQDCVSLDGIPYIGQYSENTPRLYVATGFKKWGMTSSMAAATILSDLICGNENPYAEVFSPQRFHLMASMQNLAADVGVAASGLLTRFLSVPQETAAHLANGQGGVVEYRGEKVGVYKDANGKQYILAVKCPHMGCELAWNPDELSWDCPCHGSRFDYEGHLLNNPAIHAPQTK